MFMDKSFLTFRERNVHIIWSILEHTKKIRNFPIQYIEGVRNSDAEDLKKMKDRERDTDREGEREESHIYNIYYIYIIYI